MRVCAGAARHRRASPQAALCPRYPIRASVQQRNPRRNTKRARTSTSTSTPHPNPGLELELELELEGHLARAAVRTRAPKGHTSAAVQYVEALSVDQMSDVHVRCRDSQMDVIRGERDASRLEAPWPVADNHNHILWTCVQAPAAA